MSSSLDGRVHIALALKNISVMLIILPWAWEDIEKRHGFLFRAKALKGTYTDTT